MNLEPDPKWIEELERQLEVGLASGPAFEPDADYWARKHRWLDDRLAERRRVSRSSVTPSKPDSGSTPAHGQ